MSNVVKFKKPFQFRIGVIIFFVLAVYLVILIISFMLQKKVSVYEVTTGELSSYYSCKAVALRKETIVEASASGYITYFAKDETKVGAKSLVYSLDANGNIYQSIKEQTKTTNNEDIFSTEKKTELLALMDDYSYIYSDESFYNVKEFKDSINLKIVENIADSGVQFYKGMSAYYAYQPGIVLYEIDGLEDVDINSFTYDDVCGINYSKQNLKQNEYIQPEDTVYKLITDESWYLVTVIGDELTEELKDRNYLNVKIKADNYNASVPFTTVNQDGHTYLILEFSNGVIRYASQRYLDLELEINHISGYKIPGSALIDVDFYKVPKEYITESGNSKGVLLVSQDKDGKEQTTFVSTSLYRSDDENYYLHEEELMNGSVLLKPQSTERMTLSITKKFPCVYSANKGYALLRVVDIIGRNEDYVIVKMDSSYSINNYDHIVLDGTKVIEGELIY